MGEYLLGVDAGGRGVRCSVVSVDQGLVTSAARSWSPKPAARAGFFAFDMDLARCWRLLGETVREAMAHAKVTPDQVVGMAASGMRFSLVLLDEEGRTLFAVPNQDGRAAAEAIRLSDEYGPELRRRTGHWPTPIFLAPRVQSLTAVAAELVARAGSALSLSDWIGYQLAGVSSTNPSQAGGTLLFDVETRDWAWDLVDRLSIPRRLLPPVQESGTRLGGLRRPAAETLGLLAGTPVVMGGGDTQCALLAMGATAQDQLGIIAGSTTPLQLVVDSPAPDEQTTLWTGHHCVPQRWVLETSAGPMGDTLSWFSAALYGASSDGVGRFLAEASRSDVGADGMTFSSTAQVMNAMEMSLPLNTLSFSQMEFGNGGDPRSRLSRAVQEGMAHAIKERVDELVAAAGSIQPDIRIAGGTTRSRSWTQLLCDVLQQPVLVSSEPLASALGAAVCAGAGTGVFAGLEEGASRLAQLDQLAPHRERASRYNELCPAWSRLRDARTSTESLAAGIALERMMERPLDDGRRWHPLSQPLRILATADLDEEALRTLQELGHVDHAGYREALRLLTGDELVMALENYDVFITEVDIVDAEALVRLPGLRVIAACRGNAVNVDVAACTALGVPVLGAPGRNAEAVADMTVAFVLMLARRLIEANAFLRRPDGEAGDMGRQGQAHSELQGQELGSKTIGLIGFGSVARAVARRLQPFAARVLVHDPYVHTDAIRTEGAEAVSLEELLATSDFVSLHAPVTDETRSMMNEERILLMKRGACLINTARGALVDERALVANLLSGRLAGAAVDVFAVEPPGPDHPLLGLPNVLATPHIAGNTVDVAGRQGRMIAEDLRLMAEGKLPVHVLNPEALGDFSWNGTRRPVDPSLLADLASRAQPAVSDLQQETAAPQASPDVIPQPNGSSSLKEQLTAVLELFLRRAQLDEALRTFAAARTVSSHYFLKDLGVEFHIGFGGGEVYAALGPPPEPADVTMKAKAENLDAILTGRLGGNRAAMTGRLSFAGDIRLAMGMQTIQADLIRLYSAARHEVGGVDFSAAAETPVAAQPPVAAPADVNAYGGATSAEQRLRAEMTHVTRQLLDADLITSTGGNVSVRIPGTREALITPSQLHKGELTEKMMVRIDLEGNGLDSESLAPSSERQLHCAIYRARPDVEAVIHAHTAYATILTMADIPFLPVSTEAAFFGDIPRVPFAMPGSSELADSVSAALGDGTAVLMQNHGLLVAASSLGQAASMVEVIERTSQMIWGCYALGREPAVLPPGLLELLREVGRMIG